MQHAGAYAASAALLLGLATSALADDRAIDPVGDASGEGTDIVAVTTLTGPQEITLAVEFAGDWSMGDSELFVNFAPQPGWCLGYMVDSAVDLGAHLSFGLAEGAWFASHTSGWDWAAALPIDYSVDGRVVTIVVPLELIGDPAILHFSINTLGGVPEASSSDDFPDNPAACHTVSLPARAPSMTPTPTPAAGSPASSPQGIPYWPVIGLVVLLVVGGYWGYRRLVAMG
jgi:hypothetical protein